jgi:hypothetical protein
MNKKIIELRPHQVEAVLNKFPIGPVRVFQKVVDPKLKVRSPESEVRSPEDSITASEVLRDAKGIVARALARGAAKITFHAPVKTGRDHEHKTGRRWTDKQRARWSAKMRAKNVTVDSGLRTQD